MKRFMIGVGLVLLALAASLAFRLSRTPWSPGTEFDMIGFLWLLENFPKLIGWVVVWTLVALGLGSLWHGFRAPSARAASIEAEQHRLLQRMLQDPPRTDRTGAPPDRADGEIAP